MLGIALPVYNGAKFLDATINSVLRQSFKDWKMVLVDNNSSDDTEVVAAKWAARDARIRVIKQPKTVDIFKNWTTAFDQTPGEMFTFIAADDPLPSEDFFARAVDALRSDLDLAVVVPWFQLITEFGDILEELRHEDWGSQPWIDVEPRFFSEYCYPRRYYAAYGVFRRSRLPIEELQGVVWRGKVYSTGCEISFLAAVALQGRVKVLPATFRYHRVHRHSTAQIDLGAQRSDSRLRRRIKWTRRWRLLCLALKTDREGIRRVSRCLYALSNIFPVHQVRALPNLVKKVILSLFSRIGFRLIPVVPAPATHRHLEFWKRAGGELLSRGWGTYTRRFILAEGLVVGETTSESIESLRMEGPILEWSALGDSASTSVHVIWVHESGWARVDQIPDSILRSAKLVLGIVRFGDRQGAHPGFAMSWAVAAGFRVDAWWPIEESWLVAFCRDR